MVIYSPLIVFAAQVQDKVDEKSEVSSDLCDREKELRFHGKKMMTVTDKEESTGTWGRQ